MKITIESTSQVTLLKTSALADGILCRVWEGETDSGVKVHCLIPRIAVKNDQDVTQFEAELIEQRAPSADTVACFPLRMIL